MTRRTVIRRLEDHPNFDEVLSVLATVAHIRDEDLPRLAAAWANGPVVAAARSAALSPDSPLVIEVLAAFEALVALFEDDLRGEADYVTVDPALTRVALKAVRDAVAAAYARPVLSRTEHAALMRPWRSVYPIATMAEPDLGPQAERVKALFAALPRLSDRCHDQGSRALYDDLVDRSFAGENDRADARRAAFSAAVLTSRRRAWALLRRSAAELLSRPCPTCRVPAATAETLREVERVQALCLDAACALLVADALPDACTDLLVQPVSSLVPLQRDPSS